MKRKPDASLTVRDIASIALIETLLYAHRDPVEYVDKLDLPTGKRQKIVDCLKKLAEKAMKKHLRYLNNKGHDVSGYMVEF